MKNNSHLLRPEAHIRNRLKLDRDQVRALEQIADSLVEALNMLQELDAGARSHGAARATSLPRRSANRLCFLSGARGTGKTTVLYSLLDGIKELTRAHPRDAVGGGARDPLRALYDHPDRVIVLEPLDMEALGEPANLLSAVLARVENVAEYPADEWERTSHGRGESPYARAFDEFSRVQTDAALAWASTLPSRGERGDPETLATETRRIEGARLGLSRRIDDVLRQLAAGVPRATSFPPSPAEGVERLFLLPIDDFDLNPPRCLELLRLLRMLVVPRLFTVVVGSAEMAETIVGLKMWSDLAGVAGASAGALVQLPDQQRGTRLFALAQSLAADAMRKLVPPGQVIRLGEMCVSEALEYTPGDDEGSAACLFKKLEAFAIQPAEPVGATLAIDTLASFLLVNQTLRHANGAHSDSATRWNDDEGWAYPGAAWLHAPPRRIADAWAELDRISAHLREQGGTGPLPIEGFLEFLARSYERAVREDPTFEPLERDILLDAVRRDFRGCWLLQTDLLMPVHYAPWPERRMTIPPDKLPACGDVALTAGSHVLRRWADWDLLPNSGRAVTLLQARRGEPVVKGSDWPKPAPHSKMTDPLQATIMVIHDILVLTNSGDLVGKPLVPHLELAPAETQFERTDGVRVTLPWPMPRWRTFWHFSLLRAAWNAARVDTEKAPDSDVALYRWLLACSVLLLENMPGELDSEVLSMAAGRPCPPVWPRTQSTNSDKQNETGERARASLMTPDWGLLNQVLDRLAPNTPGSRDLVQQWLWDVAVLLHLQGQEVAAWAAQVEAPPESYWRAPKISVEGAEIDPLKAKEIAEQCWRALDNALKAKWRGATRAPLT